MKKYIVLLLIAAALVSGCITAPEEEAQPPAAEQEPVPEKEPEKAPEPVYETVIIPLQTRETVYFPDGVVDRFTETAYIDDSALVKREDTYNTYEELIESVTFEYDGDKPVKELVYGPDSRLRSYQLLEYNDDGLLSGRGSYDARDNLQTRSTYEYDDRGRKTRWNVYGGSKNILSYTDYLYDDEGRLSEMKIYAPDGTLEDGFSYEYAASGSLPVRQIQYTAAGSVVQVVEFTAEDNRVMEKRSLTASGGIEYRFTYEYGDHGELLRESVYSGSGDLIEYFEMEYRIYEETRLVDNGEGRS